MLRINAKALFDAKTLCSLLYSLLFCILFLSLPKPVLAQIDPNPDLLENGQIITDLERLATGGISREGAATDGVTKLLLRENVSASGHATFCLDGIAPNDGGFAPIGGQGRAQCVTTPAVMTSQGWMVFATYQVPDSFNQGQNEHLKERAITFRTTIANESGVVMEERIKSLRLVRPPLVFIHGIWANSEKWTFELVEDSRFTVTIADYSKTNAAYFNANQYIPRQYINEAIRTMRDDNIAVTQVDLIGHSMGGLLSRYHIDSPNYKNNTNFNAGDVHKLITINTPHVGSSFANFIQALRYSFIGPLFEDFMAQSKTPVDEGAVEDLAKGSSAILSIQQTSVPGHTMIGVLNAASCRSEPSGVQAVYRILGFFKNIDNLFEGAPHDCIVDEESQIGGLPQTAVTSFVGKHGVHTNATGSSLYAQRLIELLNKETTDLAFAPFPAPSTLSYAANYSSDSGLDRGSTPNVQTYSYGGLHLRSQSGNSFVEPGETVRLVVTSEAGVAIENVLLVGPNLAQIDERAPFELDVTIPTDAIGTFEITAVGKDGNEHFTTSNKLILHLSDGMISGFGCRVGDVNCDTLVDASDSLYILQYDVGQRQGSSANPLPESAIYLPACDTNGDGLCNAVDGLIILKCSVGLSTELCPD